MILVERRGAAAVAVPGRASRRCDSNTEPHRAQVAWRRCRVCFHDGKGTFTYTKGQQVRRAPLLDGYDYVLGDAVVTRRGYRGVVVGSGSGEELFVRCDATHLTRRASAAGLRPGRILVATGVPALRKGDVVLASVEYESVKIGDRGIVVGPCADPRMSGAELRVLVDFDGKASYNYRADTQLLLAPLLEGHDFARGDAVVIEGGARAVVTGCGTAADDLSVLVGGAARDVAVSTLEHAPLIASVPGYRKGVRVVAKVAYKEVRVGDAGVVVGPCNVLTMPNAEIRVLVHFRGGGLYNYIVETQLELRAPEDAGGDSDDNRG